MFGNLLNHVWRKPEPKPVQTSEKQDLTVADLKNYVVLKGNTYPCDKCGIESPDCFKLHFADRTVCVTHKSNVNSFRPKKRASKPQSRV